MASFFQIPHGVAISSFRKRSAVSGWLRFFKQLKTVRSSFAKKSSRQFRRVHFAVFPNGDAMALFFQINSKLPDWVHKSATCSEIAFWTPPDGAGVFAWRFRLSVFVKIRHGLS